MDHGAMVSVDLFAISTPGCSKIYFAAILPLYLIKILSRKWGIGRNEDFRKI